MSAGCLGNYIDGYFKKKIEGKKKGYIARALINWERVQEASGSCTSDYWSALPIIKVRLKTPSANFCSQCRLITVRHLNKRLSTGGRRHDTQIDDR